MRSLQITRNSPDHDNLVELYRKERNSRLKERYQALYLLSEGKNCTQVAKTIKRSRRTVLNWLNAFNKGGLGAVVLNPPPGRPSRLSEEQKTALKYDVLQHPRDLGYDFSNWEGKNVAFHVSEKFDVELSARQAQRLLHQMGFTLQRPRYHFQKADPKQQDDFVQEFQKKWVLSDPMT